MNLTIDNLDGLGAVDYSAALCAEKPLTLTRTLNEPSLLHGLLDCTDLNVATPVRAGRVIMTSQNGTALFSGYIVTEPVPLYIGARSEGPAYQVEFSAVSDDWVLDLQTVPTTNAGLGQSSGSLLKVLTGRVDSSLLTTGSVMSAATVGVFQPDAAQAWSVNAGALASSAYASYRAVNGALSLQPAGTVTHTFSDVDGTLNIAALATRQLKELANDITLTGKAEPVAYVTELFVGDGTTTIFDMSHVAIAVTGTPLSAGELINDSFNEAAFNPLVWVAADPGSHLGISSGGLNMTGGNGFDGQTTLTAIDLLEIGGTLVLEVGNLQLSSGSAGTLCGLYQGATSVANCVAGFHVDNVSGSTVVVPLVNGAEVGTSFTLLSGHTYTLRIRVHCPEMQRVMQTYYAMVDGAIELFGGGLATAPMSVVFDLIDLGLSSSTPATVLYDGALTSSPATCTFVPVNSVNLLGSMGYCRVTQAGSGWVTSTVPGDPPYTRLIGTAATGCDCSWNRTGAKITFFAGRIPVAGELITTTYRTTQSSIARLANTASMSSQSALGLPPVARWLGHVTQPLTRSSADCENAAAAMLSFSTQRAAALAGNYAGVNLQQQLDVWPGDVLTLVSQSQSISVVVRKVLIENTSSEPELLIYKIAFANDWAEGLAIKAVSGIAKDAMPPAQALTAPAQVLANLQALAVTAVSTTALQVDAGADPPAGGGFEVRRRDWDFGPAVDQDFVLRSSVRSFYLPRATQTEQFYVRMYDASTPPLYSRFSSVVIANLPTS